MTRGDAALLKIPSKASILSIRRTILTTQEVLIEVAWSRYRGDRYRVFMRVPMTSMRWFLPRRALFSIARSRPRVCASTSLFESFQSLHEIESKNSAPRAQHHQTAPNPDKLGFRDYIFFDISHLKHAGTRFPGKE